jgi:nitric oxide reductase NorQ protein
MVSEEISNDLALLGEKIRNLKGYALNEGASTRLLIYAGTLIKEGISPRRACQAATASLLSEETKVRDAINEVIHSIFI